MEKYNTVPILKPRKEENRDASKYRPLSLFSVAGKVLDMLMIDRILHHVHSNVGLNSNQYGFILREELWTQRWHSSWSLKKT